MFCMTCGTALTPGGGFCSHCGTPAPEAGLPVAAPPLPQPQTQYPPAGYAPAAVAAVPVTDSNATISMVLGIFALVGFHILAAVPAIILGNMALKSIRASGGRITGEGMAKAGVVMGWISIAMIAIALLVLAMIALVAILHR